MDNQQKKRNHRLCSSLFVLLLAIPWLLALSGTVSAHDALPPGSDILKMVRFDQHLDEKLPDDLTFLDENDRSVTIHSLQAERPVILALSYFECETLCPLVRQGLVDALRPLGPSVGKDFDVILVSIDPMETVEAAQSVKQSTVEAYGRDASGGGFHFLRADHGTIDRLADAIGFRYAYDGEQKQYAHPAGIVLLTPQGRIARYFFGIEFSQQDLRLGLVEASHNKIGTAIDRLLLLCYHYDPAAGKYSFLVLNVVRLAGIVTVAVMGILVFFMWRRESQRTVPLG